ncbi:AfsR/SARP family transcriptional regulator [Dyella humicola]|uniref:AfsR/SARP family transcriptional regulator n=1 Tax=Dyella humicola TaxID=2992126 RepID=UPI0022558E7D|nr:BTAD domain-containing putative transcriptional regulator [Dyella humicola]
MLAYLAVHGCPVARGRASAALWPDLPDDSGRANLRRTLWQLPRGWVLAIGDQLQLDAETDYSHAYHVAAKALQGQALTYDEISLLSNDVLPGWYEEWALQAGEGFHQLRLQALEAACRNMTALGQHGLATQAGSAAVAAEPLRESAAEALIEAHLAQRNRYEAVQCFRLLAQRLHSELGVLPDPALSLRFSAIGLPTGTTP